LAAPEFVPSQRWISNTESELGLGIVVEYANRRVTLSFPAASEQRTYAADSAPLSRVEYPVGELITSADGEQLKVTEVQNQAGCILYIGKNNNGDTVELEEIDVTPSVIVTGFHDEVVGVPCVHGLIPRAAPLVCVGVEEAVALRVLDEEISNHWSLGGH